MSYDKMSLGELFEAMATVIHDGGDEDIEQEISAAIDCGWPRQEFVTVASASVSVPLGPSTPTLTIPDDVHTSDAICMLLRRKSIADERTTGMLMDLLRALSASVRR